MSITAMVGIGLSVIGTGISMSAQQRMAREQEEASRRTENAREQQMQLDAQRRRRQSIREGILARSQAMAVGVGQNVLHSTGVMGAMGQASAQSAENVQTVNQSEALGSRIFEGNRAYAAAGARGQSMSAFGSGLASLGGAIVNNAGTINRLGTYYSQRPSQVPAYG